MVRTIRISVIIVAIVLLIGSASFAGLPGSDIDDVLAQAGTGDELPVIVHLTDKVDLAQFKGKNKSLRRAMLIKALRNKAGVTQRPIVATLQSRGVRTIKQLWITNSIAITANGDIIKEIAGHPGVESVTLDKTLTLAEPIASTAATPEWNIAMVRSPELWGIGFDGSGIVVAGLDSGVDGNHVDLSGRWRGGGNSWFDPSGEHATPYDADGHGTQTMGIMVGGDAGGSSIGIAPASQWIAAKIYNDAGNTTYSVIHQANQWLLDPDGDPDTDDTPDVVNNSWGLRDNPGECIVEFEGDIQVLRTAGIAVVFSAGNSGPAGYTDLSPANNSGSIAVGAVDESQNIATFSSRGPSACDGSIFPHIVAPGVNIRTADLTFGGIIPDSYISVSGTSFAGPHVSGIIALLIDAFPGTPVTDLEAAILQSAVDLGTLGADNDSGFGLIDGMAAYDILSGSGNPLCTDSDGDGYSIEGGSCGVIDCNDSDPSIFPGAIEINRDGIDQDCNGYDLTIEIVKAEYSDRKDRLDVEATSSLGSAAVLVLDGYGSMSWSNRKQKWSISVSSAGGNPGVVTVSGIEGSVTQLIAGGGDPSGGSEGKGKTCSDGLDNDNDGAIDCADTDCSTNKVCQ